MIELVIVSRLLEYPDAALWQHQQEMFEAIAASKNLPKEDAHALGIFLRDLTTMDPLDAQAQYSELFDRGRATSLLLFEHVHGESRDRGQAMVDLLAQYEQHGLQLNSRELPDHLPLYLDAVWEEEQVKFFADKGCGDSAITAHQRRFAGAVAPQYLNITTGGQH